MSTLEQKLKSLIAKDLGVSPDEVTPEFIHEQRKRLKNVRMVFESKYGGHRSEGLKVLSKEDIETNHKIAEAFWAEVAKK